MLLVVVLKGYFDVYVQAELQSCGGPSDAVGRCAEGVYLCLGRVTELWWSMLWVDVLKGVAYVQVELQSCVGPSNAIGCCT